MYTHMYRYISIYKNVLEFSVIVLHVLPPLVPLRRLRPAEAVSAALFEAPTPPAYQKRGTLCVDSPAVRGAGLRASET